MIINVKKENIVLQYIRQRRKVGVRPRRISSEMDGSDSGFTALFDKIQIQASNYRGLFLLII